MPNPKETHDMGPGSSDSTPGERYIDGTLDNYVIGRSQMKRQMSGKACMTPKVSTALPPGVTKSKTYRP